MWKEKNVYSEFATPVITNLLNSTNTRSYGYNN